MAKSVNKFPPSVVVLALLLSSPIAWANGISVSLSPSNQTVNRGESPKFIVEARAIGKPARIMKFASRPDLLDNYARIRITKGGKPIEIVPLVSEPGPVSESDYMLVPANQSISFPHRGTPFDLTKLPPGNYSASVTVWPSVQDKSSFASNSVSFRVVQK